MAMITKCPSCGTTFRVTPPQLQAQHGMVRCGRCATVFDGFKTLASSPGDVPFEAAPETLPTRSEPARNEIPAPPLPADAAMAPSETSLPQPNVVPAPEPQPVSSPEPFEAEPAPRKRSSGLALGIFLLLLALAAQGVFFYRGEIAANVPEARPYLDKMCRQLGCSVALPQRPRAISIEASDLQATDAANPGLIVLTATLRNQVTTAVGYPALDVVLTNAKEHTVARRIFLPSEYLDAGKDLRGGIPPNAEMTIKLNIDSGDLGAAGFRLDLLASPVR